MARFTLAPISLGDFDRPDITVLRLAVHRPPAEVWRALHSDPPLAWCSRIRSAAWTSPAPYGVGTTRDVVLGTGIRLGERYLSWVEQPASERAEGLLGSRTAGATGAAHYANAFWVESANAPLFRRFGERYTVVGNDAGSLFTWEFLIEPRVPGPFRPLAQWAIGRDLDRIRRDTEAWFARGLAVTR